MVQLDSKHNQERLSNLNRLEYFLNDSNLDSTLQILP